MWLQQAIQQYARLKSAAYPPLMIKQRQWGVSKCGGKPTCPLFFLFRYGYVLLTTLSMVDNQVMSRAITLYMDRVTLSLGELQELEKDAKTLGERRKAKSLNAPPDEGTDDAPSVNPQGSRYIA